MNPASLVGAGALLLAGVSTVGFVDGSAVRVSHWAGAPGALAASAPAELSCSATPPAGCRLSTASTGQHALLLHRGVTVGRAAVRGQQVVFRRPARGRYTVVVGDETAPLRVR